MTPTIGYWHSGLSLLRLVPSVWATNWEHNVCCICSSIILPLTASLTVTMKRSKPNPSPLSNAMLLISTLKNIFKCSIWGGGDIFVIFYIQFRTCLPIAILKSYPVQIFPEPIQIDRLIFSKPNFANNYTKGTIEGPVQGALLYVYVFGSTLQCTLKNAVLINPILTEMEPYEAHPVLNGSNAPNSSENNKNFKKLHEYLQIYTKAYKNSSY